MTPCTAFPFYVGFVYLGDWTGSAALGDTLGSIHLRGVKVKSECGKTFLWQFK